MTLLLLFTGASGPAPANVKGYATASDAAGSGATASDVAARASTASDAGAGGATASDA